MSSYTLRREIPVQAIETQRPAFAIDTDRLVAALRQQGAYLPEQGENDQ